MTRRGKIDRARSAGKRRQHGLAMVEFVISAPLLLLLLFAITEIGRALYQYALLAGAARDADRYLASHAISDGTGLPVITLTVANATSNLVVYGNTAGSGSPLLPGLAAGQVTVATNVDAGGATNVTVSVAYPYQSLFGGSIPAFIAGGSVNTAFTLNVFTSMHPL